MAKNYAIDPSKNIVLEIALRNGRIVFAGYEEDGKYFYRGDGCGGRAFSKTDLFITAKCVMQNHKSAKPRGPFAEALKNGEGLTRCEIRQGPYGVEFRIGDASFQLGPPGTQGKPLDQLRASNASMNPSMHFVIV
jgi:hypothetical protein